MDDKRLEINRQQTQFTIAYVQCQLLAQQLRNRGNLLVDLSGTITFLQVDTRYRLQIDDLEIAFTMDFQPECIDPYDGGTFSKPGQMTFRSKLGDGDKVSQTLERTIEGVKYHSFVVFTNLFYFLALPFLSVKETPE
jgi:hypothetical protein